MRLIAERLACRRGLRLLFEDLSFVLGPGEALAVTGANGAGKSSLLRILAGLLSPDAGAVRIEGLPPDAEAHEAIHYLGHKDAVKSSLSVAETARFFRAINGGSGSIQDALDRVGLGHLADLPGGYLSAGQRRRLALAGLLMSRRSIWLLDEPTAALDEEGQTLVHGLIASHRAGGGLVVVATHHALVMDQLSEVRLGATAI